MLYDAFKNNLIAMFSEMDLSPKTVTIAFSGGADSVVLLDLFLRFKKEDGLLVSAIHVEHGIRRGSSKEDADFAERFCRERSIPIKVVHIDVPGYVKRHPGISTEEAARLLRYSSLKEMSQHFNSSVIALGHHADDQVETILLNILRGTGISGLRGIHNVRKEDGFVFLRPLLRFEKKDILKYCENHDLPYVDDETNFETEYTRNRVRLELIPFLESFNPAVKDAILRLNEIAEETELFLDEELTRHSVDVIKSASRELVVIDLLEYSKIQPLLAKRLLRQVVKDLTGYFPDFNTAISLEMIAREHKGSIYQQLEKDLVVSREYDRLCLAISFDYLPDPEFILESTRENSEEENLIFNRWRLESKLLPKEKVDLTLSTSLSEAFDYEKIKEPLKIRTRRPGDVFHPLGSAGTKKLKDFLIDLKVPKRFRDKIPLLVDAEDNIVWVVGFRISEAYKVDENTKQCLFLRIVQSCQVGSPVL